MRLKIFSYNIHGLPYLPDSWTNPFCGWLKDCDYDFICLQEVFTVGRIEMLKKTMECEGYQVLKPNDFLSPNLLGSGLLTGIRKDSWMVLEDDFIQFKQSIGAENLANKGLHWFKLQHKINGEQIVLINTHMQADHPFNYFVGCTDTKPTRRTQVIQMIDFLKAHSNIKHIIVGDLNAEEEAHEDLKYITGPNNNIRKHTFEPTGEDLDHVAYVPKFCKMRPITEKVAVLDRLWWSDHWPIDVVVRF